eukprot:s77_g25.t1
MSSWYLSDSQSSVLRGPIAAHFFMAHDPNWLRKGLRNIEPWPKVQTGRKTRNARGAVTKMPEVFLAVGASAGSITGNRPPMYDAGGAAVPQRPTKALYPSLTQLQRSFRNSADWDRPCAWSTLR